MHPSFSKIAFCISLILMSSCAKVNHIADIHPRAYRIEKASYPVDTKIAAIIEPYKAELDKTMNEVIGYSPAELIKGKPNSGLTNWFADALLEETQKLVTDKIDFAIQNYGGIRIPSLPKGDITVGKVYELMPFDNLMFIQEMDGNTVQMLFDKIAESEGWPISHTVYMELSYGKAINIRINNMPLESDRIYAVAVPDYLANGGDNLTFLKALKTHNTGALLRDLIISNIRFHTSRNENIISNPSVRIN